MNITRDQLDIIKSAVTSYSGNELESSREQILSMRLDRAATDLGKDNISDLIDEIREGGNEALNRKLAELLLTHETSFFRDFHPFETIKKELLPAIIEKKREERKINIWCAACSTGQEPYSLAMMIRDNFPQLARWNIKITATDISEGILSQARSGVFSQQEVNRGLPTQNLIKYFDQSGRNWQIKPEITAMIRFKVLNLMAAWPRMEKMDLILIRNVLIYFSPENKRRILQKSIDNLAEHGALLLGGTELSVDRTIPMKAVTHERTVYYVPKPLTNDK